MLNMSVWGILGLNEDTLQFRQNIKRYIYYTYFDLTAVMKTRNISLKR